MRQTCSTGPVDPSFELALYTHLDWWISDVEQLAVMQDLFDDVAIFWDYENCTPPCNLPGYDVVNNIREVAHAYGSVKLFKAYLELSEQSSSKSIGLRSELQSCGVSLTDCPHNGRKDVADKMMIVDMLTYAIDNPAPATIVLISGDRDFVYAVSVLRLRKYRVVLVAPNTAHASLKSQASNVLDWETDIMRRTTVRPQTLEASHAASVETLQQRSPRRPTLSLGGPLPQPVTRSARRASFKANAPLTPVTPLDVSNRSGAGSLFQGRHLRNPSIVASDESLPPSTACRCGAGHEMMDGLPLMGDADMAVDRTPIQDIVEVMRNFKESEGTQSRINRPSSDMSSTQSPSPSAISMSSVESSVPDSSQTPAAIAPTDPIKSEIIGIGHEEIEHAVTPPYQDLELTTAEAITFPPTGFEPVSRQATVGPLSKFLHYFSVPSPRAVPSQETTHSEGPRSTSGSTIQPPALDKVRPASPTPSSSVEGSPPAAYTYVSADVSATDQAPAERTDQSEDAVTASPPPEKLLSWVPAHFHPLMRVLEEMRMAGSEQPLRTTVAVRLLQVAKDIYRESGNGTFKAYSAAAAEAGVVVLGGTLGYTWISLSPEWHGRVPVTTLNI
ncbi:DUF537-domain-containing protein [Polyporus arcularius HHB13444]|uniref:DUF537-domain-containing protein n=1 Tax=Polyporus arcularius HHB13444 TaxID=1314778 RepID=A0A5C3P4D2_9APHY|nr:DUF537-domain-containing protein [Polyporus arcularius HHB13444]